MNRLILLSYQTLGKKSSEFYIIQKRRFIHRKLQVLATMNRLMFLSYQTLGKSQSSSEIYPITFRECVGYINTREYLQMKGKDGDIR